MWRTWPLGSTLRTPDTEAIVKVFQRPEGLLLWIDGMSHLASQFHDLRIALQVMHEFGFTGSEEALNQRTSTRLGGRASLITW